MTTRIEAICDLLLAAAHADDKFVESERQVIEQILCGIEGTDKLDPRLAARMTFKKPDEIDVFATAERFAHESEDNRRLLMQLIAAVHEADGILDLEEDELVIVVAGALGFSVDEIQEFIIDFGEDEALSSDLSVLHDD
jgi:uncharacterized tellurite resistance protein B-like protein